jgi:hypothetical protein
MKRYPEQEREEPVKQYLACGISQQDFSCQAGITWVSLRPWCRLSGGAPLEVRSGFALQEVASLWQRPSAATPALTASGEHGYETGLRAASLGCTGDPMKQSVNVVAAVAHAIIEKRSV